MAKAKRIKLGQTVIRLDGSDMGIVVGYLKTDNPGVSVRYFSEEHNTFRNYVCMETHVMALTDMEVVADTAEDPKTNDWVLGFAPMALEMAINTNDKEWFDEIHAMMPKNKSTIKE